MLLKKDIDELAELTPEVWFEANNFVFESNYGWSYKYKPNGWNVCIRKTYFPENAWKGIAYKDTGWNTLFSTGPVDTPQQALTLLAEKRFSLKRFMI